MSRILLITACIALLASLQIRTSDALSMTITPDKYNEITTKTIDISCRPDHVEDGSKEIMMIEISKNGEKPMALIRQDSDVSHNSNKQFQARGHLGRDVTQSYLNLTISNPTKENTGVFNCVMYFVDGSGLFQKDTSSQNLTLEDTDMSTLVKVVQSLAQRVAVCENIRDPEISTLKKKVAMLESKKTVTQSTAFTAYSKTKSIYPVKGEVLILPDLMMEVGQGYNTSTGIYTAPRKGLYAFHFTLFATCEYCKFLVALVVKNTTVASVKAADTYYHDQSSISTAVKLEYGDQVMLVPMHVPSGKHLGTGTYTFFTGYFIHPL